MNSKKNSIIAMIFIMIFLLGGVMVGVHFYRNRDIIPRDKVRYINKLLGIDLTGYVEKTVGEVKRIDGEDEIKIRMKIIDGCIDEVEKIILNKCGNPEEGDGPTLNGIRDHDIVKDFKEKKVISRYEIDIEGNRNKTQNIFIYITEDESEEKYIYVFG